MTDMTLINVHIEMPAMHSLVKYEVDKQSNQLRVDRFLKTPMYYPCNYGYIPETLADDGDALDVLVITPSPVQSNVYIQCRPIGTLNMTDEKGEDNKIIAVPSSDITQYYQSIREVSDIEGLHPGLLDNLRHFFTHYKDLDNGKWIKVEKDWGSVSTANQFIQAAIRAYQKTEE